VVSDRAGLVACVCAVILAVLVVAAPLVAPDDPTAIVAQPRLRPGLAHLFGTDHLGRDVFSRAVFGARQTLLTAVLSAALATALGLPLGLLAGYLGRWRSVVIMRSMDVLLAFPGLLLALVVVTVLGPSLGTVVIAVGVSFTPVFARVIYGSTLRARSQEYVAAARVVGCGSWRIMSRHVLPVVLGEVVVLVSSAIGWSTLLAATLNFLGFGVRPPTPEWGADLAAGTAHLSDAWWISAAPGLAITVSILTSNYLGDFVAGLLDPTGHAKQDPRRRDPQLAAQGE
jgi:ABC-type dipeptide/oligopeptide/nickel transport system permease subunit